MRSFLSALFILAFFGITYAQNPVIDGRPQAKIYVIDAQSGQETPATSDLAVLFKNGLLDLVRGSHRSKAILHGAAPQSEGRVYTVTQMGVETNINGYQVSLDYPTNDANQATNVYTFAYHVDDNTLYFYNPSSQQWQQERISADNAFNLRKTAAYAQKFNEELANQAGAGQLGQPGPDAQVDLSAPVDADVAADTAPPAMPDYDQPECPTDGYLWQPGYWAYSPYRSDYYWVPGAWVAPPSPGVLWTPPYWGYEGSRYIFHVGYWGDHVGFYGGINYGYGYGGRGYYGGEWRGGRFNYNTAVVRVNTRVVHNTYVNKTVINNVTVHNHDSFNGRGGVEAAPTTEEVSASREHHLKPTAEQNGNQLQARNNPNQFNKTNPGGKPVFASPKAAPYHPQVNPGIRGNNLKQPITPVRTKDPSKPDGLQGGPVKPQGQQANPVKPQGQQAKPEGLTGGPVKAQGQPANPREQQIKPAKPDGLPAGPAKPQGQPTAPVKQPNRPATPVKPDGLPGAPNKPQGQPNTTAKQRVQPTSPVRSADPSGLPGQPVKTHPQAKPKVTPPVKQPTPPAKPTNQ